MKKLILALTLVTTFAFAGHDKGGGGIGLLIKGEILLYDFVEGGIEDDVYINADIADEMNVAPLVKSSLLISREGQALMIAKLNEIYKISPTFAIRAAEILKTYQWRFVSPTLVPTRDLGHSPINVSVEHKQLAFRDDYQKVVTIDKESLSKMPLSHQVGLYFHEILYAFSRDVSSYQSRSFTSYLFHPRFQYSDFEEFSYRFSIFHPKGWGEERIYLLDYKTFKDSNSEGFLKDCSKQQQLAQKFVYESLPFLRNVKADILKVIQDNSSERWAPMLTNSWLRHQWDFFSGLPEDGTFFKSIEFIGQKFPHTNKKKHITAINDEGVKQLNDIKAESIRILNEYQVKLGGQCEVNSTTLEYLSRITIVQ